MVGSPLAAAAALFVVATGGPTAPAAVAVPVPVPVPVAPPVTAATVTPVTAPTTAAPHEALPRRQDAREQAADAISARPAQVNPGGTLGPSVALESFNLGYVVHIRVYEPPAGAECAPLPVVYVTDGSDYWKADMGNVVATLDRLIASGRMSPVLAVFIDAWDPLVRRNRRYEQFLPAGTETREPFEACPFCDFIAEEVVPWVEARYPVDPERRGILGTSLGGLNAAYMALTYPELFHLVGIQSPSIWRQPWLAPRIAGAPNPPRKVAIDIGADEPTFLPGARALRDAYSARGVALQYREVAFDHSWAHWRATAGEVLEFLYAPR